MVFLDHTHVLSFFLIYKCFIVQFKNRIFIFGVNIFFKKKEVAQLKYLLFNIRLGAHDILGFFNVT